MAMTKKEKQGLGDGLRTSFTSLIEDYTRECTAFNARSGNCFNYSVSFGYVLGFVRAVSCLALCLDGKDDRFFHDLRDDFRHQIDVASCGEGGGADA